MYIMILNDLHLSSRNPLRRTDNYRQAVLDKVTYFLEEAEDEGVDIIVCGGDVFENTHTSNLLLDDFADIIEYYGISWLIVPGNHDEVGQNWENSNSSSLAHLVRRCSHVKILDDKKEYENFDLVGHPYYYGIENDLDKNGMIKKEDTFTIAIVHAMITPKSLNLPFNHVSIDELKTDYDIIFVAHNHEQHGKKTVNGTDFYFSGCIGRRKINEASVNPTAYIIDTDSKEISSIRASVPHKEDTFDMESYEEMKEYDSEIESFISTLENTEVRGTNIREIVDKISESKKVKKFIFDKMTEYEEEN